MSPRVLTNYIYGFYTTSAYETALNSLSYDTSLTLADYMDYMIEILSFCRNSSSKSRWVRCWILAIEISLILSPNEIIYRTEFSLSLSENEISYSYYY